MTGFSELPKRGVVNRVNFAKAARLAQIAGTTTVLMTGKGEPTLYPEEITEYLGLLAPWGFPFIEVQTNALEIGRLARDGKSKIPGLTVDVLKRWHALGLNTIAISVVSERAEDNRLVYHQDYPDLGTTIAFLHSIGFTVRLCVMMLQGAVDSPDRVEDILAFCRTNRIEQLTVRPIRKTEAPTNDAQVSAFVSERGLDDLSELTIATYLRDPVRSRLLLTLSFGAEIFDVGGQNVCLSDCLTVSGKSEEIRTLIFYSDGRLTYDWQYEGAVLLGGATVAAREAVAA
jgi:hypothetical protein